MKKICLIQVWFGKLPDFFEMHLRTCSDQKNIDFLFFTDQVEDSRLQDISPNIIVKYLDVEIYKDIFQQKIHFVPNLTKHYKLCDHKILYPYLFSQFLIKYDYVGFYDIDVFFGDIYSFVKDSLEENFISIGDEYCFPGIRGPFAIWKNIQRNNEMFLNIPNLQNLLMEENTILSDENNFNQVLQKKQLHVKNFGEYSNFRNGEYIEKTKYENKQLFINDKEAILAHFFYKNSFKIYSTKDAIYSFSKKNLVDDYYWVTYFDKKYEPLAKEMLKSIEAFSNRKVIIYTIDYELDVLKDLSLDPEQFFTIKYIYGSNENVDVVKNIKSHILKDSCTRFLNKKMVYVDADIFMSVNCDSVTKYFSKLKNYPLINLNVHDFIFMTNFNNTGKTISSLQILGEKINIKNYLFPRRKCNFMVYDSNSFDFFRECVYLYETYKNTEEGIFGLYDEDAMNILLSKYSYKDSLPTVDIEEVTDVNQLEIFYNYSYSMSNISESAQLPKSSNDILCFHKIKTQEEFKNIREAYLQKVMLQKDLTSEYSVNKKEFLFKKKSFFNYKQIPHIVTFKIINENSGEIIESLNNQKIHEFGTFFINRIDVPVGNYKVEITDANNELIIYSNLIQFSS